MNKKKTLIIGAGLILVIAVVVIILLNRPELTIIKTQGNIQNYEPEFMTAQEKTEFNLPQDSKIQVLKREDDGSVDVYKIIRDDNDVIYNLDEIK